MMAANALAPVSGEFAKWYASQSVVDDGTLRGLRYKGVVAAVDAAGTDALETWVRIAFKSKKTPQSAALDAFRVPFQVDKSFPTSGNDHELQILAATCLAQMMEKGSARGLAALVVTTSSCQKARTPKLPMDLVSRAEATIVELAESGRTRPEISKVVSYDTPKFDFSAATDKVTKTQSFNGVIEGLSEAEEAVRGALKTMGAQFSAALGHIERHIKMKDEELQMLWWLTGARSIDLDCDFSSVAASVQPLVFASELSSLTEILPGPASVKGLLSRAGLKDKKKLTIAAAVSAVPLDWAKAIVGEKEFSPVTMPVHFALARRIETGGTDDAWVANWASVAEILANHEMSGLALGVQFYRERLLALHL